ncbi:ABC transporter ATP-binding protein [Agromyces atrinae]|uniref:ABC transporter ATP-binding protein n=1 Tax=Agromyces atrinae TaxID=592376 RepID=A0A4Q2M608_9MICO|nr:ABC transporter ATP-binding protein [Agromyces atrinae]NYD67066.1 ATP-binding cassette subfamily B protein [Agromyces atrinae]RXZ85212.1 ABC transporter ATP-binding protein [Agromyces atrinae]RXZ85320.1 ABC transporter ATP-binding protein [Agromyces atrinae]
MTVKAHSRIVDEVDCRHPTRSIFRLLGRHKRGVAFAVFFFALKETPVWLLPVITGAVIDIVVSGGPASSLLLWTLIAFVALAQNFPNHLLYTRFFMRAVRQTGADLRNALASRLQSLSIGFHTRASSSIVQTKVVRDVENVEVMLQQVTHPLLSAVMVMVGALVMTAINVPAFLPVYALTIPIAVMLRAVLAKRSRERNEKFRREVEHFSARVGEMATLMPITRAHGLESTAVDRVAQGAEGVRTAGYSLDLLNGRFASLSWVSLQLLGVGCLVLAAWISISGWLPITAGQVVLLSSYFALLTGAVTGLLMLLPIVARGTESVRSIAEVLQEPDIEFNEGKSPVDAVAGGIALESVGFQFPDDDVPAITGIDLEITPGETIAFVGSSGSGKSTMLNLVLGFLRPTSGRIMLDGVDMESLDLRSFRRFVSVVPQESVLFEGSIRENIAYGLGDVSDERVLAALRDANALEIIEAQPDGWNTVVGERGARLSGGQRQRIAIARALVRDPRVLLLDEATSALDPASEAKVRDALGHLMQGRTTLVVAHRLSTIRSADRIVVLEKGRIVEVGPHDELIARNGRYAELHRVQTG